MSKTKNVDFPQLLLSGENYLTWCMDVELHLASKELEMTIMKDKDTTLAQKASALCFIRHHMMQALKTEYLTIRDPQVLWEKLKIWYGHQIDVILPKARHEWHTLRFQDFKFVAEYNSVVHNIISTRTLCGDVVDEATMIDKTLSTFDISSIALQRQYRNQNYQTHAELIQILLIAEQNDQLLVKNHNMRHAGRGRGRRRGRTHNQGNIPGIEFPKPKGQIVKARKQPNQDDKCHNCGKSGHWAQNCPEGPSRGPQRPRNKAEANHVVIHGSQFQDSDFFGDTNGGATTMEKPTT